jgi:hypothetical protein
MPANMVGPGEEAAWERAKRAANKQYPDVDHDSDKYWSIVNHIFQNMKALDLSDTVHKAARLVVHRRPPRYVVRQRREGV